MQLSGCAREPVRTQHVKEGAPPRQHVLRTPKLEEINHYITAFTWSMNPFFQSTAFWQLICPDWNACHTTPAMHLTHNCPTKSNLQPNMYCYTLL
jgi:hypothetical protein